MYEHFDRLSKMNAKVQRAMAYPMFVLLVAVVVVVVLMVAVVPAFLEMFQEFDIRLPLATRILIVLSDFLRCYGIWLALMVFVLVTGIRLYSKNPRGRINLAKIQLKLPVLGTIAVLNAASQFANSMALLISSGLSITRAIHITAKVMDNACLSESVGKLSEAVEQGRGLGASMRAQGTMPHILVNMIALGEDSGELVKTLQTAAGFYDSELDQAVLRALALMEPVLIVVLGSIATFIVFAVYLAMFTLYSAL